MSKDLIFSMACKITDTTEKRTYNQEQFRKHFPRLSKGLKDYADICGADFKLLTPKPTDYDTLNMYKIQKWEQFLDQYDRVLYLDLDIIPNTKINIFEKFDFDKIVTHLIPVNDYFNPVSKSHSFKAEGESATDFYERSKTKEYEQQKKELDRYHWLFKGQFKKDMFRADGTIPGVVATPNGIRGCKDEIPNTGTFGGSKVARNKLKFFDRLDHCKKLIDSIKHIDDRYFYNNEVIIAFMIDRYNVPVTNLPPHWHDFVLSDTPLSRLKYSYFIHVITKDFEKVFDILDS
tara:strand:- start:16199 stop:17068 length:870 start_codon:yes stop_codon:yes gene_type:complete